MHGTTIKIYTEKLTVSCFFTLQELTLWRPFEHFYLQSQFLFEVKISVSLTSLSSCFSNYVYLKMGPVEIRIE